MGARPWMVAGISALALALASGRARADHDIYLETTAVTMTVPDDWEYALVDGKDHVRRVGGALIGKVQAATAPCAELLDRALPGDDGEKLDASPDLPPGWSGFEYVRADDQFAIYCRDVVVGDARRSIAVEAYAADAVALVAAFGDAIDRAAASAAVTAAPPAPSRSKPPPTAFERFGPTRYELGLARFTDGPAAVVAIDRAWGLSLALGRSPWTGHLGLVWTYQARLAATGAGADGAAEVGAGLNLKVLALQAIAGVGVAGDAAPLAAHGGGQVDLLLLRSMSSDAGVGVDAVGSLVWRAGGTAARIQGRFVIQLGHRAYTFGIGWERRLESETYTIDLGTMTMPDLY